jgi:hypothetical protein
LPPIPNPISNEGRLCRAVFPEREVIAVVCFSVPLRKISDETALSGLLKRAIASLAPIPRLTAAFSSWGIGTVVSASCRLKGV